MRGTLHHGARHETWSEAYVNPALGAWLLGQERAEKPAQPPGMRPPPEALREAQTRHSSDEMGCASVPLRARAAQSRDREMCQIGDKAVPLLEVRRQGLRLC